MTTLIIVVCSPGKENIIKKSKFLFWRIKLFNKTSAISLPCVDQALSTWRIRRWHLWKLDRAIDTHCFYLQILFASFPIMKSDQSLGGWFAPLNWIEGSGFGRLGAPGLRNSIKPLRTANTAFFPVKIPWRDCRCVCCRTSLSLFVGSSLQRNCDSRWGRVEGCMECSFCSVWTPVPVHCRRRECYCCTWSHSMTHTHSVGLPGRGLGPSQRLLPIQHAIFTRTRNPREQAAIDLRVRPRGHQNGALLSSPRIITT